MDHLRIETMPEAKQSGSFVTPTTRDGDFNFYERLFNGSNNCNSPLQNKDGQVPEMEHDEVDNRMKNNTHQEVCQIILE
jgi:hypothetical protein